MTALRPVPAVSTRAPRIRRRRWAAAALFLLLLALLFTAYLRLSQTYAENSDEANILLMAGDLARGNLILSGWNVSDVPFITTELPEIAVLVRLFGLRLDTAHIAAALTYTAVVGVAMLLASGWASRRGRPRHPLVRMAVVLAIMLSPQPGVGVFVLLFSVGHIGTAAPVMVCWLFLDRCYRPPAADEAGARDPRRAWWVPVVTAVLLAWALIADPLVEVIAVGPLLLVMLVRVIREINRDRPNGGGFPPLRPALARGWLELSLAAAALAAYLAATGVTRLLHAAGGYTVQPVPFALAPAGAWYGQARTVVHGLLELFGAFFLPGNALNHLGPGDYVAAPPLSGFTEALAVSRLACVALALAGVVVAVRGLARRDADLAGSLLLVGLLANLVAYIPSTLADHTALNVREVAPVLPFAAVLAARTLGDGLGDRARFRRRPGTGAVLAGALVVLFGWYAAGLAAEARLPAAPSPFARLGSYLEAHHLSYGIGGYWNASVITVGTEGAVTIRAVTPGCLGPYNWESKPAWYSPANNATFVLTSADPGFFSLWVPPAATLRQLASLLPAAPPLSPGGGYQVYRYAGNVLAALPRMSCRS